MEAVASRKKAQRQVTPAKTRKIKKVAVLGSGVMDHGDRHALRQYRSAGWTAHIVPRDASEEDLKKPAVRNKIANDSLAFALKSNPSPTMISLLLIASLRAILTIICRGLEDCDWVIEVVVENLDIKKKYSNR
jgi:3-hydroxyacyl-CoA dehydrogenase